MLIIQLLFVLTLLFQNYRWRPSIYFIVNVLRSTALSAVLWAIVCALVATALDDPTSALPYQVWISGTSFIGLLGFPCYLIGRHKLARQRMRIAYEEEPSLVDDKDSTRSIQLD